MCCGSNNTAEKRGKGSQPANPDDVQNAAWTFYVTAHHDSQAEMRAARHEFWDDITKKIHEAANEPLTNLSMQRTASRKNSPIQVSKQTAARMMYFKGITSILANRDGGKSPATVARTFQ